MSTLPPPPPLGDGPPPPYTTGHPPPPPPPQPSPGASWAVPAYAGFWRRAGARVLDALLVGAVTIACLVPAIVAAVAGDTEEYLCVVDSDGFELDHDLVEEFGLEPNARCEDLTDEAYLVVAGVALLGLVPLILFLVWFYRRLGRTGQSPGRAAAHIAVVDANTGLPIGGGRAFGRDVIASNLSLYVLGLGFLWAIWDKRKQTWHDKIVTSVVVRTTSPHTVPSYPSPVPPPPPHA